MCLGHVSNVGFVFRVRDPTSKFFGFGLCHSLAHTKKGGRITQLATLYDSTVMLASLSKKVPTATTGPTLLDPTTYIDRRNQRTSKTQTTKKCKQGAR